MILNPNCSEAVMRIRTDAMTEEQKTKLLNELTEKFDSNEDKNEAYDTSVSEETIFGIPHIAIDGQMPYNNSEDIDKVLEEHNVSEDWVESAER